MRIELDKNIENVLAEKYLRRDELLIFEEQLLDCRVIHVVHLFEICHAYSFVFLVNGAFHTGEHRTESNLLT